MPSAAIDTSEGAASAVAWMTNGLPSTVARKGGSGGRKAAHQPYGPSARGTALCGMPPWNGRRYGSYSTFVCNRPVIVRHLRERSGAKSLFGVFAEEGGHAGEGRGGLQ